VHRLIIPAKAWRQSHNLSERLPEKPHVKPESRTLRSLLAVLADLSGDQSAAFSRVDTGPTIAEHFRTQGQDVLLLAGSRLAETEGIVDNLKQNEGCLLYIHWFSA
jgi:vacuolar-type H+-ATPase catalytic subunit A/Vma1